MSVADTSIKFARRIAVIALSLSLMSTNANGFEFGSGRAGGLGGTIRLSNPTASEQVDFPTYSSPTEGWRFETGYIRQWDIPELDQLFAAAAYRHRSISLALGYLQFGSSEHYQEQTIKASFAYHRQSYSAGLTLSTRSMAFGERYESLRMWAAGFSVGIDASDIKLSANIDNINSPVPSPGSRPDKPIFNLLAELPGRGMYSLLGRVTLQQDEKPQFAVGQFINPINHAALFWGITTGPATYGGGVEVTYNRNLLRYSANYHPELGLSHCVSFEYSIGAASNLKERVGD